MYQHFQLLEAKSLATDSKTVRVYPLSEIHKAAKDVTPTRDMLPCLVCRNLSKMSLYGCGSGYVICENCQYADTKKENRQDRGDYATKEEYSRVEHNLIFRKNLSESSCAQIKDLGSGDYDKCNKTSKSKLKSKSEHTGRTSYDNYDLIGKGTCNDKTNQDAQTVVKFKNAQYRDSKSSNSSLVTLEHENKNYLHYCSSSTFSRPVICPVSDCKKMLAMNSIMQHFYFDHSKVPRITLDCCSPQQVLLKACNVTVKTQCLAVYLHPNKKSDDQKTLLLVGVRLQTGKNNTKITSSRNSYTQTGVDIQATGKDHKHSIDMMENNVVSPCTKSTFDNNEIFLLWICKLDTNATSYSITVSREDKKKGQSFIGEAIQIRDKQDAITMYQRSECLTIHGVAANRLLDDQNQFLVFVNVLE